jgi:hypothetical protein
MSECLAILVLVVGTSAHGANQGVMIDDDSWQTSDVAMDDYLLKVDFVLTGEIGLSYDAASVLIPVEIKEVHIGAVPHRTIVLMNIFPRAPMSPHTKVLAWGTWDGANGDTCFGNALPVSETGALPSRLLRNPLKLDGSSLDTPGSLSRLTQKLASREQEHPSSWLARGTSIALVEVTAVNRDTRLLHVAALRTLVGTPAHFPTWLLLSPRSPCRYIPTPKDTLLISTSADDTLRVPVCVNRLKLHSYSPTLVGCAVSDLSRVYVRDTEALTLRRMYDVGTR